MGLLRIFLAISVLVAHNGPLFGLNLMFSDVAVKLFFIISGFYMSMVLSGKYSGPSMGRTFYTNRFLRLYPAFLLAILATFAVSVVAEFIPNAAEKNLLVTEFAHRFSGGGHQLDVLSLFALAIPNLLIVGSDIVCLFCHSVVGGWHFTFGALPTSDPHAVRGGYYLLIWPVWSVGVELWFYLFAPMLVRIKTVFIVLLAAASLTLRLWMDWKHPWITYYFFPAALCFFLYGMLAHRFWSSAMFKRIATPQRVWAIAGCGLAMLMLREFIPFYRNYSGGIYAVTVVCLPFIFEAFKGVELDRWVGNMSYPFYLFHTAIIQGAKDFVGSHSTLVMLVLTLAVSFVVNYFVEEPLESYRQRRASQPKRTGAPVPGIALPALSCSLVVDSGQALSIAGRGQEPGGTDS